MAFILLHSQRQRSERIGSEHKYLAWHYLPRSALFKDGKLLEGITIVETQNGCVSHKGYRMLLPKSVRFLGGRLVGKYKKVFVDEREGWKEGFEPSDVGTVREEGNADDLEVGGEEHRDVEVEEGTRKEGNMVGRNCEGRLAEEGIAEQAKVEEVTLDNKT